MWDIKALLERHSMTQKKLRIGQEEVNDVNKFWLQKPSSKRTPHHSWVHLQLLPEGAYTSNIHTSQQDESGLKTSRFPTTDHQPPTN